MGEALVVGVDAGAADQGGDRCRTAAFGECTFQLVQDGEADRPLCLGAAPVQGDRGDDRCGQLVLDDVRPPDFWSMSCENPSTSERTGVSS